MSELIFSLITLVSLVPIQNRCIEMIFSQKFSSLILLLRDECQHMRLVMIINAFSFFFIFRQVILIKTTLIKNGVTDKTTP